MMCPSSNQSLTEAVAGLQAIYGLPSQSGFGSAVFDERIEPGTNLEAIARHSYQYFVGSLWEQYGESAWMGSWKQIYVRPEGIQPDIVAELKAIADPLAVQYLPILLLIETNDQSRVEQALATVFNHPQVTNLSVYAIGDGAAMSGLLLAGSRTTGETTVLVSLLD